MRELSVFADESGADGFDSSFYLLTLVLHDQDCPLARSVSPYVRALHDKGLSDIPFHMSPLLNGHDQYASLDPAARASLLSSFALLFHYLPISYKTFSYRKRDFASTARLSERMRRDLVNFLFDDLPFFQQYDLIKIYYDNGQHVVTQAMHDAFDYALARRSVVYRDAAPLEYRLSQAADYACGIELTALKYVAHEETPTDRRFFGSWRTFKKNVLKSVRKKAFSA